MVNIAKLHYTEITHWECDYCYKTFAYFGRLCSHLKTHNVKFTPTKYRKSENI